MAHRHHLRYFFYIYNTRPLPPPPNLSCPWIDSLKLFGPLSNHQQYTCTKDLNATSLATSSIHLLASYSGFQLRTLPLVVGIFG